MICLSFSNHHHLLCCPDTWLDCCKVSSIIEEGDLECLEALHNVLCVDHEDCRCVCVCALFPISPSFFCGKNCNS